MDGRFSSDESVRYLFIIFRCLYPQSSYEIGNPPDSRSMSVCKERLGKKMVLFPRCDGVSFLIAWQPAYRHVARQVTDEDFKTFDFILCMDDSNLRDLQEMSPLGATAAVRLLGSFDPEHQTIIKDPYYGGQKVPRLAYCSFCSCCRQ